MLKVGRRKNVFETMKLEKDEVEQNVKEWSRKWKPLLLRELDPRIIPTELFGEEEVPFKVQESEDSIE